MFNETDYQQPSQGRMTDDEFSPFALRMIRIIVNLRQTVEEDRLGFSECDTVLLLVRARLAYVPPEGLHLRSLPRKTGKRSS